VRTIHEMVDELMDASRVHGETHADHTCNIELLCEWSTDILARRTELIDRVNALTGGRERKKLTMWKLINGYAKAVADLKAHQSADNTGRAADLQIEIRERLKRVRRQYPMAGAVLDGMDLS